MSLRAASCAAMALTLFAPRDAAAWTCEDLSCARWDSGAIEVELYPPSDDLEAIVTSSLNWERKLADDSWAA